MRQAQRIATSLLGAALLAAGCASAPGSADLTPKPATPATVNANQAMRPVVAAFDKRDFDDATRGKLAALNDPLVKAADGRIVWDTRKFDFLKGDASASVNPSLWRNQQLQHAQGLFKVADGIYQIRGYDIANMTLVEGNTGWIVIDTMLTAPVARAGLKLAMDTLKSTKPVVAVIYTHSHADHFGGVRGVISDADVASGRVKIIAPKGFMEEAVGENVIAGNVMSRRALYQFGMLLPRGEKGQVDAGLGKSVPLGTITLIPPTMVIEKPVETHRIDGIDIVFENTPGAEAPAEFIMFYPQFKVLNMSEIGTQNFHNLLPMRGAQVRDPVAWSKYFGAALQRYGANSEIMIAQHHWPVWGSARVQNYLKIQRDSYKYLHDQTLRLMNQGYVGTEIAETMKMPPSLSQDWSTYSFYGDLKHNVKAIYQRYLGYYDANPANLHALPPVAAGRKAVEYMGGADAVLKRAREDYAKGEYRWVAQVMSQLVFADPANKQARELGADALEQLGYQVESATARNAFLQGAWELRNGVPKLPSVSTAGPDVIRAVPLDMFFDYLGVRLNGDKAQGKTIVLNWKFTDTKQDFVLNLENSALTHVEGVQAPNADATLTLTRATLDAISLQQTTFPAAMQAGQIKVAGNPAKVGEMLGLLETFPNMFPIVEPRPAR